MTGRQPATGLVAKLLKKAELDEVRLLMSAINMGEVYYVIRKQHSEVLAEIWRDSSGTLPVTIEVPRKSDIWNAAELKGTFSISYADAFAAALALKCGCPLVTGDPEFRRVKGLKFDWIGDPAKLH
jgi:ribonuclease VapC